MNIADHLKKYVDSLKSDGLIRKKLIRKKRKKKA